MLQLFQFGRHFCRHLIELLTARPGMERGFKAHAIERVARIRFDQRSRKKGRLLRLFFAIRREFSQKLEASELLAAATNPILAFSCASQAICTANL